MEPFVLGWQAHGVLRQVYYCCHHQHHPKEFSFMYMAKAFGQLSHPLAPPVSCQLDKLPGYLRNLPGKHVVG